VYYYESAFEDDYDDMRKNAADNLRFIRKQMRNIDENRYLNYDKIALKGIDRLNNGYKKDAEKMLKMSFIMGNEISWIGLALFYYPLNENDEALTFLNRYIKRSKERNFIEEAYTLAASIYEEEGDKAENSSVSDTISMYKKAVSALNSALKFAQDSSSKKTNY
jgi:tetratricopeptide (TPR) repeat protein